MELIEFFFAVIGLVFTGGVGTGIFVAAKKHKANKEYRAVVGERERYRNMIHRTQQLELSELGEIKTECSDKDCQRHNPTRRSIPLPLAPANPHVVQNARDQWKHDHQRIKEEIAIRREADDILLGKKPPKYCIKCNRQFHGAGYLCLECNSDAALAVAMRAGHVTWAEENQRRYIQDLGSKF